MDSRLYDIFSKQPNYLVGNKPRLELYRDPVFQKLSSDAKKESSGVKQDSESKATTGTLTVEDSKGMKRGYKKNNKWVVDLGFTTMGDKGPLILFLHGVPSNRKSYYQMMNLLKPFCRCVCVDMLGMGESQIDRKTLAERYNNEKDWQYKVWLWKHDTGYIDNFMRKMYGDEKFIFFSDDWGSGIGIEYAAMYPNRLLNTVLLDPITLDGYPVSEIEAIGKTAALDDETFQMAMGAFNQTAIQIYKTMVHKPDHVINQYTYRWIQGTYVDVDYVHGFSSTLGLKWNNLRNLADRAYILGGPQLLPFNEKKNKMGVKYSKMKADTLILWGQLDNMMPEQQRHRLRYIINIATNNKVKVETRQIPDAGHFAAWDNPDFVAAQVLDYLMSRYGVSILADVFLGFKETLIWKGDEQKVIKDLRKLLNFK